MIDMITAAATTLGVGPTCDALGVPRASYYREVRPTQGPRRAPATPRRLSAEERAAVLALLHEERFVDRAPAEIYATLLDEKRYVCSIRTMYRVLAEHNEVRERRDVLRHPTYTKPTSTCT
jgi:putative transposase